MIEAALRWIRRHSLPGGGISISSRETASYPEVSGYFVPTLLSIGEIGLAEKYAKWLVTVQKADGSFAGAGLEESFAFDTGQVVRGWVAALERFPELEAPLRRACDWLVDHADPVGRILPVPLPGGAWSLGARGEVSEAIHLYCIGPLMKAGEILGERRYGDFAKKAADWYCAQPGIIDFRAPGKLTHFHAYVMEALVEVGREDLARKGMEIVKAYQLPTGAVPAYHDVKWVCSTGLAQLAQVWYMLGENAPADAAMDFLAQMQNASGGFFGSMGPNAEYFPSDEISWACKYAIEAQTRKVAARFDSTVKDYPLEVDESDGRVRTVLSLLGNLDGKRVLDAGCGSGRYLRMLSRKHPGASLHGCDISPEMLSLLPEGVGKKRGTLLSLPYPDASFDAVICVEALEHSPEPDRACREMARLLAPGGILVVVDKDARLAGTLSTEPWERWFAESDVTSWLEHAGLVARSAPVPSPVGAPEGLFLAWTGVKGNTHISKSATRPLRRLAVVPTDPLNAYAHKSHAYLKRYFNPGDCFDEVYCLSPWEDRIYEIAGMKVVPTRTGEMASRVREYGIDVVRAYGAAGACDLAMEAHASGVPVIVSVHDVREDLIHPTIVEADLVISVSTAVSEVLARNGVEEDRIRFLPNRVDLDLFHPIEGADRDVEELRRRYGNRMVLHVGRKHEQKNGDGLVRALRHLPPDVFACFLGNGDATKWMDLARSEGVIDRCVFLPAVSQAELAKWFAAASCMCVPSRWEGFGMVFIEALACGCPVVSSARPPMTELMEDGRTAVLVADPEDPRQLAKAIAAIQGDATFASRLSRNGVAEARRWEIGAIENREAGIYRDFLAGERPRAGARGRSATGGLGERSDPLQAWKTVLERIRSSRSVIDLGCGSHPIEGATVAVDRYVDPVERSFGEGGVIDTSAFEKRGIRFVEARIDKPLPFADKEFDFAYSSHAFEHLEDPETACREMMRIAREGAIIVPSIFAEGLFGRPYHRWLIADRGNVLVFMAKRAEEDRPFGEHPRKVDGRWSLDETTNPFDMLLNESNWYESPLCMPAERIRSRMRHHWFARSTVFNVIFHWRDNFRCLVLND